MSETATLKPSYHALAQPAEFEEFLCCCTSPI